MSQYSQLVCHIRQIPSPKDNRIHDHITSQDTQYKDKIIHGGHPRYNTNDTHMLPVTSQIFHPNHTYTDIHVL